MFSGRGSFFFSISLFFLVGSFSSSLGSGGFSIVVLVYRLNDGGFFFGVNDGDGVGERFLGVGFVFGVRVVYDFDFDIKDILVEENVVGGVVDEVFSGLIGVDYEVVCEFYGFGVSSVEFVGNDDFVVFGVGFYDEVEDIIVSMVNGKIVEEFVVEGFVLSDGGEIMVLDFGGVEGD